MIEVMCSRCERSLPSENFKPDPRYKSGFTAWCKECHREKNREWYALNKAKHNKRAAEWRRNNPEKSREINLRHQRSNKQARAESHAQWAKKNRDKRNATVAKRKAAKLQATPKWVNWRKVREIYRTARRLQEFTGIPMHVDHIVPLQGETVCGLHWEGNLRVIPASENIAKHNKLVDEAARQPDMFVQQPAPAATQEVLI